MENYSPYWSENVLFIGVGASVSLGLAGTDEIGKQLTYLADEVRQPLLSKRVEEAFDLAEDDPLNKEIVQLLTYLSDEDENHTPVDFKKSGISQKRYKELQELYDWSSLKKLIKRCPRTNGFIKTQDIFNLVDMSIQTQQGVYIGKDFVRPERMQSVRNMLVLFTILLHTVNYSKGIEKDHKTYEQYYEFALILAKLMQKEGLNQSKQYSLSQREFYLFSYAMISMNWDPLFLWFIFNAHKQVNDQKGIPLIGDHPPEPLKLFNDLAHFMAVRSIDSDTPGSWYPMNETAVQRLNDEDHCTGRRVRVGKFYFPHGCHGFRECPNCGKLTFYLGDQWNLFSKSLFPPNVISSLHFIKPRSNQEDKAQKEGKFDAIQCSHCGTLTELHHTPIIMQTNFKGSHAPFIEEIQRDMKVAIQNAKHFILFGYSLPPDDVQYNSILTAKRQMEEPVYCSIINYDENAPDRWLEGNVLLSFIKANPKSNAVEVCNGVINIFGEKNVRAYLKGIPNVFLTNGKADEMKVKEMLTFK